MDIWSQPIRDTPVCIVDLETTGVSPQDDGIVEVAMIRLSGDGAVIDSLDTLVDPERPVAGTDIHGITDEDVRGAPKIWELSEDICHLLNGAVFVSYNVYFDLPFLERQLFREMGIRETVPSCCAMYVRGLLGLSPSRMTLSDACKAEGIDLDGGHIAFHDAAATQQLWSRYLAYADEANIVTFEDFKGSGKSYKFMKGWSMQLPSFKLTGQRCPNRRSRLAEALIASKKPTPLPTAQAS